MVKIAVLGGGINGCACALKIKERFPQFEVVLMSDDFSPYTTGDNSGGLWYPYLVGDTPETLVMKWGIETYDFLHELWLQGSHKVSLFPFYYLHRRAEAYRRPIWAARVFGYKELNRQQLEDLSKLYSSEYAAGEAFASFVSRPPAIISYLHQRFLSLHGSVRHAKLSSLAEDELKEYDVVVNCTGLGARDLVPDDSVFPIRGQIAKVKAPWVREVVIDEDRGNYIIPNSEFCVLGGTHQEHDYNTHLDPKDTEDILNGCTEIMPSLKNAEVLSEWVGLRPGRHQVRLEAEEKGDKLYIHNYGHGGSGLSLFWGCATDVVDILKEKMKETPTKSSKL